MEMNAETDDKRATVKSTATMEPEIARLFAREEITYIAVPNYIISAAAIMLGTLMITIGFRKLATGKWSVL